MTATDTTPQIRTEVRDHVLLIGLSRPKKRNAFSLQMLRELAEAFTKLEAEPELRCGLVFADGEHFTAGLDLAEVGPAVAANSDLFPNDCIDPLDLFGKARTKPVVCAVQGYCLTLGIELLLACDIRLAADNTRFRQMEVNRGIMPFGGATLRFPRVAGWGNAMRYLLTGDEFDATEAFRMGLVQEVTTPDALFERALALATRVAECAPLAVVATRSASKLAIEEGSEAARAALMPAARALMKTADAAEGVRSFVERRKAVFRGE